MKHIRRHTKVIALCASCAALGAAASAIATAGAATGSSPRSGAAARTGRLWRGVARHSVHGNLVVSSKSGFATVTFDRGFIQSVNGQQITIADGTKHATYKTFTLTIPGTASVLENGRRASLSDLRSGQHILVVQGPGRTLVIARNRTAS
ncbi:MAG: hypothetical protein M3076_03740 [Actinomycetota bacterium]|nr:hypothetical protein [Actinomycetota bacterium]